MRDHIRLHHRRVGARFTPLPFAPVMESYVIPHMETVLEAIYRTVNKKS